MYISVKINLNDFKILKTIKLSIFTFHLVNYRKNNYVNCSSRGKTKYLLVFREVHLYLTIELTNFHFTSKLFFG